MRHEETSHRSRGVYESSDGKHDCESRLACPLQRVISPAGFTRGALAKAAEHNVAAIAAEEMTDEEREAVVLGGLRSLWPKTYTLTPKGARVWVVRPDGSTVWFEAPEDVNLYTAEGADLGLNLREAVTGALQRQATTILTRSVYAFQSRWRVSSSQCGVGS